MISQFFSHYWKGIFRNAAWRRNLLSKIVFGILVLYILLVFIYLGASLDKILARQGGSPIDTFNSVLLWYFAIDLLVRSMLQPLPVIQVIPYLRFNIRRSKVIHYLFIKSIWNIFNLLPWLVLIPFAVKFLPFGFYYIFFALLIVLINNFLAIYIQYLSQKQFLYTLIPVALVALVFFAEKAGGWVSHFSILLGSGMVSGNIVLLAALLLIIAFVYTLNRKLLYSGFYLDEIKSRKNNNDGFMRFLGMDLFNRFGMIGKYMSLEVNLLFRNKRPRQGFVMLPFLWVYLMYVMGKDPAAFQSGAMAVYFISIIMGMTSIIYGQFLFSWESSYFDGIAARRTDFHQYVLAKFYLMCLFLVVSCIPLYLMLIIIAHFNPFLLITLTLFVAGPIHFIVFYMSTFNDGRVDLDKGQFFNYQGVKGKHFLVSLAFFLIPFLLFLLFKYLFGETIALVCLSFLGLLFFALHKYWIKAIIVKSFLSRKYKNLEGFRKLTA